MIPSRALAFLVLFLLASSSSLRANSRHDTAYVVLSGEILSIDLETGRILRRFDFFDHVGMADQARLTGRDIVVTGVTRRATRGLIHIDPKRMLVRSHVETPNTDQKRLPGYELFPPRPETFRILKLPRKQAADSGLELVIETQDGQRTKMDVDEHVEDSPFESLDSWTLTQYKTKLLVLSKGGFKYQSYLRIYAYPSLRRLKTIPLMKIRDHVPVALFVL